MTNIKTLIEDTLVPHTAFVCATTQLEQCFRYAEDAKEPICLPIIGESRTGKSRSLENLEMAHPRLRTAEGMHVPVFSVRTPAKPTVKGLAERMLHTLGDPKFGKGTEQVKTYRLQHLLSECQTRMVVVDEFQHFVDKGSSKIAYHVADWLKMIVGESKVAIVVSGLPNCIDVLRANEQLAGRFMAPVVMPRFKWNVADHRAEFAGILAAFHEQIALHFDLPDLSSDEMAFRFHCASGGLMGYITKILRTAVWMALDENRRSISLEDFEIALKKSVEMGFQSAESIAPFSRDFSINPTTDLLDRVAKIGTRVEIAFPHRGAARRKGSKGEHTK